MTRRFLSRLRKSLKRIDVRGRTVDSEPADLAWQSMLARIETEDRERRLRAAEAALNGRRA